MNRKYLLLLLLLTSLIFGSMMQVCMGQQVPVQTTTGKQENHPLPKPDSSGPSTVKTDKKDKDEKKKKEAEHSGGVLDNIWSRIIAVAGVITILASIFRAFMGDKGLLEFFPKKSAVNEKKKVPISNLPKKKNFEGREDDVLKVLNHIKSSSTITILSGPSGCGKTSLANYLANRLRENSERDKPHKDETTFSCFIWISLTGQKVTVDILIDRILSIFQISITSTGKQKEDDFRGQMNDRHCLFILDNFDDTDEGDLDDIYDFLNSLPAHIRVIVTSIYRYSKNCHLVELHKLSEADFKKMLIKEVESSNSNALKNIHFTDDIIKRLYIEVGGMPQAVVVLLGRIIGEEISIDQLFQQLKKNSTELYEKIYGLTWSRTSDEEKLILYILTQVSDSAAINLLEYVVGTDTVKDSIDRLRSINLVEPSLTASKQRFLIHTQTKQFIEARLDKKQAREINKLIFEFYNELLKEIAENATRFSYEINNFIKSVNWAFETRRYTKVIDVVDLSYDILFSLGSFNERIQIAELGIKAAELSHDSFMKSHFHSIIASTYSIVGKYDEANIELETGLATARDISQDQLRFAYLKRCQGFNEFRRGNFEMASQLIAGLEEILVEVIESYRNQKNEVESRHALVDLLSLKGSILIYTGAFEEATETFSKMLEECRDIPWKRAISYPLRELSEIKAVKKDFKGAMELAEQALDIAKEFKDFRQEGRVNLTLSKLNFYAGNFDESTKLLTDAMDKFKVLALQNELEEASAFKKATILGVGAQRFFKRAMKYNYSPFPIGGD